MSKSKEAVPLDEMSLTELRVLNAQLDAQRQAILVQQRQVTKMIDLRAYEAGETPEPPAWTASPDQTVSGFVATGRGD